LDVEVNECVLTYPTVPRPCILEVISSKLGPAVEIYMLPSPCTVEMREDVLTYDRVPRPLVVEVNDKLLT
jgi:hypothetical protein